jgi:hypothetical protein
MMKRIEVIVKELPNGDALIKESITFDVQGCGRTVDAVFSSMPLDPITVYFGEDLAKNYLYSLCHFSKDAQKAIRPKTEATVETLLSVARMRASVGELANITPGLYEDLGTLTYFKPWRETNDPGPLVLRCHPVQFTVENFSRSMDEMRRLGYTAMHAKMLGRDDNELNYVFLPNRLLND